MKSIIIIIIVIAGILSMSLPNGYAEEIPLWVKNTAGWWAEGNVSDDDFVNGIGFLIKSGIITLPVVDTIEGISEKYILNILSDPEQGTHHEISFNGIVTARPIVPVYVTLFDPDGIVTESETSIDSTGNYSIIFKFDRDSKAGIYYVSVHHMNKLVKEHYFKLEKISTVTTIPSWIKNNAGWWANNSINDDSFIQGIQFLVKNRILILDDNDIGASFQKNIPSSKYKETHIENFPDPLKTPEYYLDRYYGEQKYRKWFDTQFQNTTIYEILGLIQYPTQIMEYIVPSNIFSELYNIEKQYTKYLDKPTLNSIVDVITETEYSSKYGDVTITIWKIKTPQLADSLFDELLSENNYSDFPSSEYYFQDNIGCLAERLGIQTCKYDKYLISTDLYWGSTGDPERKMGIIIIDKIFQNISLIENKNYESQITSISRDWETQSTLSLFSPFTYAGIVNFGNMVDATNSEVEKDVKSTEGFSGLYCKQDGNWVEMTGRYTNGPNSYSSIFFKLGVLDNQDRIVATGIGSISNVQSYQTKMFEAAAEWNGSFKECIIEVDTAFP